MLLRLILCVFCISLISCEKNSNDQNSQSVQKKEILAEEVRYTNNGLRRSLRFDSFEDFKSYYINYTDRNSLEFSSDSDNFYGIQSSNIVIYAYEVGSFEKIKYLINQGLPINNSHENLVGLITNYYSDQLRISPDSTSNLTIFGSQEWIRTLDISDQEKLDIDLSLVELALSNNVNMYNNISKRTFLLELATNADWVSLFNGLKSNFTKQLVENGYQINKINYNGSYRTVESIFPVSILKTLAKLQNFNDTKNEASSVDQRYISHTLETLNLLKPTGINLSGNYSKYSNLFSTAIFSLKPNLFSIFYDFFHTDLSWYMSDYYQIETGTIFSYMGLLENNACRWDKSIDNNSWGIHPRSKREHEECFFDYLKNISFVFLKEFDLKGGKLAWSEIQQYLSFCESDSSFDCDPLSIYERFENETHGLLFLEFLVANGVNPYHNYSNIFSRKQRDEALSSIRLKNKNIHQYLTAMEGDYFDTSSRSSYEYRIQKLMDKIK